MPKFNRIHYKKIAEILSKNSNMDLFDIVDMKNEFIKMFKEDNPLFDEEEFKIACEKEVKKDD